MSRIDEIRQRVQAATEGPLAVGVVSAIQIQLTDESISVASVDRTKAGGKGNIIAITGPAGSDDEDESIANAEFFAHAREDIPWLLDQLDAKDRQLAEAREALAKIANAEYGCDSVSCQASAVALPTYRALLDRPGE